MRWRNFVIKSELSKPAKERFAFCTRGRQPVHGNEFITLLHAVYHPRRNEPEKCVRGIIGDARRRGGRRWLSPADDTRSSYVYAQS